MPVMDDVIKPQLTQKDLQDTQASFLLRDNPFLKVNRHNAEPDLCDIPLVSRLCNQLHLYVSYGVIPGQDDNFFIHW